MPRLFATMVLLALTLASQAARSENEDTYKSNPPRSQQDISRERTEACKKFKGQEYQECLANYVGKDRPSGGTWKRPANPPKTAGRT
jgi:hypothetical protein